MADKAFVRRVALLFDKEAGKRMQEEARDALEAAGKSGGEDFTKAMETGGAKAARALSVVMKRDFDAAIASGKLDLAKGLIDEKEFQRRGREAAAKFNVGMVAGMEKLRGEGKLTDSQFASLANRLKRIGTASEEGTSVAQRAFGRLKEYALGVGTALAAAFAVRKIVDFGKAAIAEFTESQSVWSNLEQSLANVGVAFSDVEDRINGAARAMQDTTRIGDEDFASILSELTQISSDYAASMDNVSIVADLAAAKHIDLHTAAQLVGRAMIGDTGTLKRYGIVVQEGADAVEVMRAQFRGFAERDGKTFSGQLARVSNEWGDFKEALGQAMVEAGGGTSVMETLIGMLKALAIWTANNKDQLRSWVSGGIIVTVVSLKALAAVVLGVGNGLAGVLLAGISGVVAGWSALQKGAAGAIRAIAWLDDLIGRDDAAAKWTARADAIDANTRALDRYAMRASDAARASFVAVAHPFGDRSGVQSVPTPRLDLGGSTGGGGGGGSGSGGNASTGGGTQPAVRGLVARVVSGQAALPSGTVNTNLVPELDAASEKFRSFYETISFGAEDAGRSIADGFTRNFQLLFSDIDNIGRAFGGLWTSVAQGVLGAVAQEAQGRATLNFVKAIESTAMAFYNLAIGNAAGASLAFKAAGGFALSGAEYAALAGGAGALGARSGGNGVSGSRDVGVSTAERSQAAQSEVNVFVQPFDPSNPVQATQVGRAVDLHVHLSRPEWAA